MNVRRTTQTAHGRKVMNSSGAWGVSHTRVPTESRPGHVAIIAGLYEDPSAIAKGWKENPVEFDSLFNQSRFTWSWGSPDILPMFARGATGDHVLTEMYGPEVEDFSGQNKTSVLDTWVFDRVELFLHSAKSDPVLSDKLQQDKLVFFLHLLGLDTAGHSHKPHSKYFIVKITKEIIRIGQWYSLWFAGNEEFGALIPACCTEDGSHGAGERSETETPLVAWGAGIRGPLLATETDPPSPRSWELAHVRRSDVRQADIAPLMATLLGVPIPANSVGFLPREYLSLSEFEVSEAVFTNAQQMAAQYNRKRELTESGTISLLYRPFPQLTKFTEQTLLTEIRKHIEDGQFTHAINASTLLFSLSLAGLDYYQNYYQCLLLTCVSLSFLGWLLWLLLPPSSSSAQTFLARGGYFLNMLFMVGTVLTSLLIYVQSLPCQYYVYCILPEMLWWVVLRRHEDMYAALRNTSKSRGLLSLLFPCAFYLVGIEILRDWLCGPWYSLRIPWRLRIGWLVSCASLAVFPSLPVVGREANTLLVHETRQSVASGCVWVMCALMFIYWVSSSNFHDTPRAVGVLLLQVALLSLAIWNIHSTSSSLGNKQGLLSFNQSLSWALSGISMLLPLCGSQWVPIRLVHLFLSLALPFLLLSASHEGFFLLALNINLLCWLTLEHHHSYQHTDTKPLSQTSFRVFGDEHLANRSLTSSDIRRAYFFVSFVLWNIASINSFDPTWVHCFLTVFSPFVMTALILWKTMIPFLIVTCVFRAVNIVVQAPTRQLFLIVLVFCDGMGLHFLHLVTNQGSWLDIGTSISHYVIMQTTVLFLLFLYEVARGLTGINIWTAFVWFPYRSSRHPSNMSLLDDDTPLTLTTLPDTPLTLTTLLDTPLTLTTLLDTPLTLTTLHRHTTDTHSSPRHATDPDNSPRHATDPDNSPRHATDPDNSPRHTTDPENSPRHATDTNNSPRHTTDPDNSPRHATDTNNSPRHTTDPDNSPRHATDPDNSPRHTTDTNNFSRHATDLDNSPRHTTDLDNSPRHTTDLDNSPRHTTDLDNSPRHATDANNSPRHTTDPDNSPRHATDPDNSPRHATDTNNDILPAFSLKICLYRSFQESE
uniref:GPI ethanolamine phosphate transferase 1 n=1 Tax=Timema poppense TaxID=170557 RepID=A0A7R9D4J1_TIMPO|nr:unnamed protein product [Timema poppensis]